MRAHNLPPPPPPIKSWIRPCIQYNNNSINGPNWFRRSCPISLFFHWKHDLNHAIVWLRSHGHVVTVHQMIPHVVSQYHVISSESGCGGITKLVYDIKIVCDKTNYDCCLKQVRTCTFSYSLESRYFNHVNSSWLNNYIQTEKIWVKYRHNG